MTYDDGCKRGVDRLLALALDHHSKRGECQGSPNPSTSFARGVSLGLSTQPENPSNLSNPPEPEPVTARTDHSDGWWQVAAHRTRHLWVDWWVSSPKPKLPKT